MTMTMRIDLKEKKNNNNSYLHKRSGQSAFTLIEFLIYSGIVVFVVLTLTLAGMGVLHARVQVISMEEVHKNATLSLEKTSYLIRHAKGVESAAGDELVLDMPSPVERPTTIYFDSEEEAIMIERGEEEPQRLTSSSVEIDYLDFQEFLPDAVRMEVTFSFYNPTDRAEYETTRTFHLTENVR